MKVNNNTLNDFSYIFSSIGLLTSELNKNIKQIPDIENIVVDTKAKKNIIVCSIV